MSEDYIIRLPPNHYIHVLDQNTNVSRIEVGPQTFVRKDQEIVLHATKQPMVTIPPSYCCLIENPVILDSAKNVVKDEKGQAKLKYGDIEYRFEQEPFPLYPGEILKEPPRKLQVILANEALKLKAKVNFTDGGKEYMAGDEWYFKGPGTYYPRKEVEVGKIIKSVTVKRDEALHMICLSDFVDDDGVQRIAGEEWLMRKRGEYLCGIYENIVKHVKAYTLDETTALHLLASRNHTDEFGIERKCGSQWLVTSKESDAYIPDVCQEFIGTVKATSLNVLQYCVIIDPVGPDGKNLIGQKKLMRGPCSFFLQPNESLDGGIKDVYQLTENDGLVLKCIAKMEDKNVGDLWLLRGPCEYVPPVTVQVIHTRKAIALDENEGIYVRNLNTGKVRTVIGGNYMLSAEEELWDKELPSDVEKLLYKDALAYRSINVPTQSQTRFQTNDFTRTKYSVVTYRIPHNAVVQIFDYRLKKSRIVFGPELVLLEPDEHFSLLSLSGGVPKQPNAIKALCLLLGPDFLNDVFTIETADHARLSLRISLNWFFNVKKDDPPEKIAALYSVPDFIGDACKAVASRIRGVVSGVPFDEFHKNSASIIQAAVFGKSEDNTVKPTLSFPQNNLIITSLDIISLEPVDQKTRDALQKTVQLAIEITTNSQEAAAKHEAMRLKLEAEGRQERQKLIDAKEAEKERKALLELRAENMTIETCGQAIADSRSQAQATKIECESAVEQAKLKAESDKIMSDSELARLKASREAELEYITKTNALEIEKTKQLASIEVDKFKQQIEAVGQQTLIAMANAGPDTRVKMLQALGLKTALITDGVNPINLFDTASGLVDFIPKKTKYAKITDEE